jgi:putative nucleotidyltransferase with HDIG domain
MDFELVLDHGEDGENGRAPGPRYAVADQAELTIGRSPRCTIVVADEGVSRHHCRVVSESGRLMVIDLGTLNSTFINDAPIDRGELRDGDRLTIGTTTFVCHRPDSRAGSDSREEPSGSRVLRRIVETPVPGTLTLDRVVSHDALHRAHRTLETAYQISQTLATAPDVAGVFESVMESILQTVDADRAALLLRDAGAADAELRVAVARTRGAGSAATEIAVSSTVTNDVLSNGVSMLIENAAGDLRYQDAESIVAQDIRSIVCAPITSDGAVRGVIYVDKRALEHSFTEADMELLAHIGSQTGVALHRAELADQFQRLFLDTMRAMVATIDAKDGYTHRHSERVAMAAVALARELGRSDTDITTVKLSGLLHDIGKIGVPEAILNKPGPLTEAEHLEIRKHPEHGVRILAHIRVRGIEAILPGVRSHHEKWDGSGYPDGLAGEEIPWLGRLLAVADVLDALSSNRSYRGAYGVDRAVAMIVEDAGRHFDPVIANALQALHERGVLQRLEENLEFDVVPSTG